MAERYTVAFRNEVVLYGSEHGYLAAAKKYGVKSKTVSGWISKYGTDAEPFKTGTPLPYDEEEQTTISPVKQQVDNYVDLLELLQTPPRKSEVVKQDENWFNTHLIISKFPTKEEVETSGCDVLVNVSDLYRPEAAEGVREYWFPLGEAFGFSLSSIYGALKVMHEAYKANQKVLLHCHAGKNRSQTVYECLYYVITAEHAQKSDRSKLMLNINDGQLPGIYKMDEFLDNCREVFGDSSNLRPIDWIKHEMHMMGSGF